MNYYPQYIHVPTAVPVQRYFADPHVRTNEYDLGGIIGGIGDKLGGVFGSKGASLMGGLGKIGIGGGMLSGIGSAVGNIGGKAISGGLSSGAGKAISGIGSAVGGIVGKVNPLLGAAVSAASGILGGLTNRAFGSKLNDAAISAIDSDIDSLNNTRVTDSSNESIANQAYAQNWGSAFDKSTVGKDGWFANKAQKEYERLQRGMLSSQNYMAANYDNAATNVQKNMMNNMLINAAAFGGPFDNPFSHPGSIAIAYGNEQQQLNNQRQMLEQMQLDQQQIQPRQYGLGGGLLQIMPIKRSHTRQANNQQSNSGGIKPIKRPIVVRDKTPYTGNELPVLPESSRVQQPGVYMHTTLDKFGAVMPYEQVTNMNQINKIPSTYRDQTNEQYWQRTYPITVNAFGGNLFGCGGPKCHCLGGNLFAEGGITNSHGSDFTNDLMYIDAGGSHEDNPYQGVPMGHDSQGVPNVVEQGEIVVPGKTLGMESDFVISNRIPVSDEFAEKYPGAAGLTCAQAARKLTAESRENPNDIIARNTDKVILRELVEDQERTKAVQQQQMMQEAAMQQAMQTPPEQQMMAEQEQLQGPAMDEMAAQAAPEQYGIPMQPQTGAFGGKLFGFGGPKNYFDSGDPIDTSKPFVQPSTLMGEVYNQPAGNQPASGYTFGSIWREYMAPSLLEWAKEHIRPAQSAEERNKALADLNRLQWLYHAAQMPDDPITNKRKSDAIKALQEHAQSMGINNLFTEENAQKIFSNHKGLTPDKSPLYVDGENGTQTKSRHAGMSGMYDSQLLSYLRNAGINAFADNDLDNLYNFENSTDWYPGITEAELNEFQNDPNGNGEVYTPVGEGTNPESDTDDYYGSHAAGTRLYDESLRYAPIWASGIATLTDALGITNRPDYSAYNSLLSMARRGNGYMPVSYHPTGEQMRYMPYDPILQTITNNANTAATRRAIQDNSNGNAAMRNAALLPLNMQANLTNGQLGLQGRQYNDQLYNNVLTFNNGVNERNAHGIFSADAQNAQNWAYQNRMFQANLASAIEARQAEKARVDAARSLNLSNFVKGLGALGKENAYYNMVNTNAANLGYGLYRGNGVMYNPWRIDQ